MTFDELGASLRAERERRGLRIEDAADHLKISARHLRALEEGDGAALPHPAYARGFLRSYAAYLGMSPDEIHNALTGVTAPEAAAPQQPVGQPEPAPGPRVGGSGGSGKTGKGGALFILVLLLVAAGAYAGWRWGMPMLADFEKQRLAQPAPPLSSAQPALVAEPTRKPQPPAARPAAQREQVSPAGERAEAPRGPAAGGGTQPAPTRTEAARTELAQPERGRTEAARAGAPQPAAAPAQPRPDPAGAAQAAAAGQPSEAGGATAPAPGDEGATPGQHKVIITATEECWIHSNADKTDTRQFSLRKGDTFALTFARSLELKLGNAGGVRIRYDGESMPPAGQSGQVRTLTFPPQAGQ